MTHSLPHDDSSTAIRQKHAVLILSPRWQTRVMLAAQLGEMTKHDVVSAPGVDTALKMIKVVGIDPVLLIVDVGQELTRQEIDRLLEVELRAPVILIVGAFLRSTFAPLHDRCAAFMTRPVSIGEIARNALRQLES